MNHSRKESLDERINREVERHKEKYGEPPTKLILGHEESCIIDYGRPRHLPYPVHKGMEIIQTNDWNHLEVA